MTDDDLVSNARRRWEQFCVEMTAWERDAYATIRGAIETSKPQSERERISAASRERLTEILDRYGITGVKSRNRIVALGCSDPPGYDLDAQVVESIAKTGNSVEIVARQTTGLQATHRFTLSLKGRGIVLSKKELLDHTDNWKRVGF